MWRISCRVSTSSDCHLAGWSSCASTSWSARKPLEGLQANKFMQPSHVRVAMGWISSVAVIQAIMRTLVFRESEVPEASEIAKTKPVPDGDDLTVIYLDSFDQLRPLSRGCHETLGGESSERHARFLKVCRDKGLPLNEAKRLVAATRGPLQGGELDGDVGRYGVAPEKMCGILGLGGALLAMSDWTEWMLRHFVGKATFGMCFRRPLFSLCFNPPLMRSKSGLAGVMLPDLWLRSWMRWWWFLFMVPMMFTNLQAELDMEISVMDASPYGGGAAVASKFRRGPLMVESDPSVCYECGGPVQDGSAYPCPADLLYPGLRLRTQRQRVPQACMAPSQVWEPCGGSSRAGGSPSPLTCISATICSRIKAARIWHALWAMRTWSVSIGPRSASFSQRRGVGPLRSRTAQPLGDLNQCVIGLIWWVPLAQERDERKSPQEQQHGAESLAAGRPAKPPQSLLDAGAPLWLLVVGLYLSKGAWGDPRLSHAVGSACCFGGRREKLFSFSGGLPSEGVATQRADGTLVYLMEEEAEYPWRLCEAYAAALRQQLDRAWCLQRGSSSISRSLCWLRRDWPLLWWPRQFLPSWLVRSHWCGLGKSKLIWRPCFGVPPAEAQTSGILPLWTSKMVRRYMRYHIWQWHGNGWLYWLSLGRKMATSMNLSCTWLRSTWRGDHGRPTSTACASCMWSTPWSAEAAFPRAVANSSTPSGHYFEQDITSNVCFRLKETSCPFWLIQLQLV